MCTFCRRRNATTLGISQGMFVLESGRVPTLLPNCLWFFPKLHKSSRYIQHFCRLMWFWRITDASACVWISTPRLALIPHPLSCKHCAGSRDWRRVVWLKWTRPRRDTTQSWRWSRKTSVPIPFPSPSLTQILFRHYPFPWMTDWRRRQ